MNKPVTIVMVEDDEGHARLIERNIRRAGVTNEIIHFSDGASAFGYFNQLQAQPADLDAHSRAPRFEFTRCLWH